MCYFLVEIYTLQSQAPILLPHKQKWMITSKRLLPVPLPLCMFRWHLPHMTIDSIGWYMWIALIIIAPRMNWMTHWSIARQWKGRGYFCINPAICMGSDSIYVSGEYSAPDEALDQKTMTRVGSNYTPIPHAHSSPYPLCFLVLTDSFTPISGLPTSQL